MYLTRHRPLPGQEVPIDAAPPCVRWFRCPTCLPATESDPSFLSSPPAPPPPNPAGLALWKPLWGCFPGFRLTEANASASAGLQLWEQWRPYWQPGADTRVLLEKTPGNIALTRFLAAAFRPSRGVRLVMLVRHPVGMTNTLRKAQAAGREALLVENWLRVHEQLLEDLPRATALGPPGHARALVVRWEDLMQQPQRFCRGILAFIWSGGGGDVEEPTTVDTLSDDIRSHCASLRTAGRVRFENAGRRRLLEYHGNPRNITIHQNLASDPLLAWQGYWQAGLPTPRRAALAALEPRLRRFGYSLADPLRLLYRQAGDVFAPWHLNATTRADNTYNAHGEQR